MCCDFKQAGLLSLLLGLVMSIVVSSIMIHNKPSKPVAWTNEYVDSGIRTHPSQVKYDWTIQPFTSITVIDADYSCPEDFPDEVIYNLWPGTRMMCDCIERDF